MQSLDRRNFLTLLGASATGTILGDEKPQYALASFSSEITPPVGHPCMGGGIAPVSKVLDPLYAIGFVLLGAGKPMVYVALDWCEVRNDAYDAWRQAIADAVSTTRERVLVSSVHQHDTPISDLYAQRLLNKHDAKGAICDLEFHAKTVERVAKAAKSCLKNARTITHIGYGSATVEKVASNRRYLDAKGQFHYNRMSRTVDETIRAADAGLIDPLLKTISFWSDDQALLALHCYATHPMSYYGRGEASADFVGIARKLRTLDMPKVPQIYASGCSGNVTAGKYNDGSVDNRPVLAKRIYTAMCTAWDNTKRMPIDKAEFRSKPVLLTARDDPEFKPDAMLKQLKEAKRPFDQCLAALGLSWHHRVQQRQTVDVPVIDFGKGSLLLLPAEAYVEYQLYAQKQRPDDTIISIGYGKCGPGYIPVERAWKEKDSNLHDWCWVNPDSEALLKNAIKQLLAG